MSLCRGHLRRERPVGVRKGAATLAIRTISARVQRRRQKDGSDANMDCASALSQTPIMPLQVITEVGAGQAGDTTIYRWKDETKDNSEPEFLERIWKKAERNADATCPGQPDASNSLRFRITNQAGDKARQEPGRPAPGLSPGPLRKRHLDRDEFHHRSCICNNETL